MGSSNSDAFTFSPDEIAAAQKQSAAAFQFSPDEIDQAKKAATTPKEAGLTELAKAWGGKALDTAAAIGKFIDSYTGAPARKGLSDLQEGKFRDAIPDAIHQFGADPELAPTGKQIAEKAGVTDKSLSNLFPGLFTDDQAEADKSYLKFKKGGPADISASGAAGLGVDLLADPTNLIPGEAILKGVGKGLGVAGKAGAELGLEGAKLGAKGLGKVAGAVVPEAVEAASKVGDIATETARGIEGAAKSLASKVKPSIRPQYAQDAKLAIENGIDPNLLSSAIKYGPESFISKAERVEAQGVTGEQKLLAHQEGLNQVRQAVDRKLEAIGGGSPLDTTSAGELIRRAHNDAVDRVFGDAETSYNKVWEQNPGLRPDGNSINQMASSLEGIRRKAVGMVEHGTTDEVVSQGSRALKAIERLNGLLESGSYKQLVEQMQAIGKAGFKRSQGQLSDTAELYRDMYGVLKKGVVSTVESQVGKQAAEDLVEQNKVFSKFLENNEKISAPILDTTKGGETVFKNLIESGDSAKLRALKEVLKDNPAALGQLKATFIDNLKQMDHDGGFSLSRLHGALQNDNKVRTVVRELFTPEEATQIEKLSKLGHDFGPPILNHSGTQVSHVFTHPIQALGHALANETVINTMKKVADNPEALEKVATEGPAVAAPVAKAAEAVAPPAFKLPMRTRRDNIAKALQVFGASQEQGPIEIPGALQSELRDVIKASSASNSQKAVILNHLHRTGTVDPAAIQNVLQH